MAARKSNALPNVADRIGRFMHYWGFSKIDGRIWTHLYLSAEPLSAGELRKRLGVSKALISLSLKELTHYGVVVQTGTAKHGVALFASAPDLGSVVEKVLRTRERVMLAEITAATRALEKSSAKELRGAKLAPAKITQLREMCESAEAILEQMILARCGVGAIAHFGAD